MRPSQTASSENVRPVVLWAQRADKVLLTIVVEDCKNPMIQLEKDRLHFRDDEQHEVTLDFFKPVKEDSNHVVKGRGIEFSINKEESEWWPRLLKDPTKRHWLKVDFQKWKDEDDSDDEMGARGLGGGNADFGDFMQQFGGMAGAGDPSEDMGDEDLESDDDNTEEGLPDLA